MALYNALQGNLGLGKAIEYFTSQSIPVAIPLNDTQKYDIIADFNGSLQRISVKTVEKMVNELGCKPENIICCICPSIRKCHFEVDKDVKDLFEEEFKDLNIGKNTDIMEKQKDKEKWNIDTVLINKIILEKAGLKTENIIDSGLCSVCNKDLIHSFRVEKQGYGLNTALIALK